MPKRRKSTVSLLKPLGPGALVFCYCRDSGGTSQEKSVADQKRELEAYAQAHGWTIAGWWLDEARKSGDMEHRDAFMEMIGECRRDPPPVAGILFWAFARLFRDEIDAAYFKSDLRRRGVNIASATDQVPEGPFSFIYETFLDCANRIAIDKMAVDVRRGLRSNILAGCATAGKPPTGYLAERVNIGTKRDGSPRLASKWVVDPEKRERVLRVFEMYAAGHSYPEIHVATGLFKSPSCLSSVLRNVAYVGTARFGDERFPDHHPALVDGETWEKVQVRMDGNTRFRPHSVTEFILSGLVVCGECGRPMGGGSDKRNPRRETTHGHGRPWRYYRCTGNGRVRDRAEATTAACSNRGRVGADALEGWVVRKMLDEILTAENLRAWMAEMQRRLASPDLGEEIESLDQQIARARRQRDNLLDLVEDGDKEASARYRARKAELGQLEGRRAALVGRQAAAQAAFSDEQLVAILAAMRSEVTAEETLVVKRALRSFVERVEVLGDGVRLTYRPEAIVGTGVIQVPPRSYFDNSCTSSIIAGFWRVVT